MKLMWSILLLVTLTAIITVEAGADSSPATVTDTRGPICDCHRNRYGCGLGSRCKYCKYCLSFCGVGNGKKRKRAADLFISDQPHTSFMNEISNGTSTINRNSIKCTEACSTEPLITLYCDKGVCMNNPDFKCCPECPDYKPFTKGSCDKHGECRWTSCSATPGACSSTPPSRQLSQQRTCGSVPAPAPPPPCAPGCPNSYPYCNGVCS